MTEVTLVTPSVRLVRTGPGQLNVSDLLPDTPPDGAAAAPSALAPAPGAADVEALRRRRRLLRGAIPGGGEARADGETAGRVELTVVAGAE